MSRAGHSSNSGPGIGEADGPSVTPRLSCDELFTASREPVLIVDAASNLIIDANPRAADLLQLSHARLLGASLTATLDKQSAGLIHAGFALAQRRGGTHALNVCTLPGRRPLFVRVSMFRIERKAYFLMRLRSDETDHCPVDHENSGPTTFELIDDAPAGFLLTNVDLRIDYANRAFITMINLTSQADVHGQSLANWLDLSRAGFRSLQWQLRQRQAMSRLRSTLRCSCTEARLVEVYAIAVPDDLEPCWGFSVDALPVLN